MASRTHLALVFIAAFLVLFVLLMPARSALSWLGLDDRLHYGEVTGTLLKAELSGVRYRGMPVGHVTVEPSLGALLSGSFSGDVQVRGQGVSARAAVSQTGAQAYIFRGLALVTPVAMVADGWPLRGTLSLNAPELVLDESGCNSGRFTLRTDIFGSAFAQIDAGNLVLAGDGSCANGQVSVAMSGENELISLRVNAEGAAAGSLVANVSLTPKGSLANRDDLQMAFNFAGLRRDGNAWRGEIRLPLGFQAKE